MTEQPANHVHLGKTDLLVSQIGVGTNVWSPLPEDLIYSAAVYAGSAKMTPTPLSGDVP
jgi:aryl-alcohol dehydrogenase-like predicted oxidoreductase